MKNRISIPKEQFKEIEKLAKDYSETPGEMVEHILEAQLEKIRHKQIFYPGLKWDVPKATFIQAAILKRDFPKLRKWIDAHNRITIFTQGEDGTIYLLNEECMDALASQKTTEDPSIAQAATT
jgi:hypothetical protein